jgi:sodium/proline symporter
MGNRSVNYWLTALSAHSSDMSVWLFMGFPGAIFLQGLPQVWIAIGLILGMWANWYFIAPPLRRLTESYDSYTLSTFFERRFNDPSGSIRLVTGIFALLFLTAYLTSGVIAMGQVIESLFLIPYEWGILITMPILIVYVFLGGFVTVAWVDCFQAIFLVTVILIVPAVAYLAIGGASAISEAAAFKGVPIALFPPGGWDATWASLIFGLSWGIGYFGQPHIITKFMGISDPKQLRKSMILGMSWQVICLSAAVFIGVIAIAYFPLGIYNHEMVFIEMVKMIFNPFTASFILCAVIAANMSTMDSQVLVAGSIFSEDILRKITKHPLGSKVLLKFARVGVVLIPVIASILAMTIFRRGFILDMVGYAWSGLGTTFGPIVFAALFMKSINKYGVLSGVLVGATVAALWPILGPYIFSFPLLPIVPGFIISFILMWGVSNLTARKVEAS